MLKNAKKVLVAISAAGFMASCSSNFEKSETGLEYKIFEDKEGEKAKVGDFLTLHFEYKTKLKGSDKDTILRNTWKDGNPIQVMVQAPSFKGGLEEGLQMLSEGDSASFKMPLDSLFKKTFMAPIPDFLDSSASMIFTMKVIKVQNKEAFEKDQQKLMEERRAQMEKQMAQQEQIDVKLIEEYVAANNLAVQKTPSGLNYIIRKQGKGKKPAAGSLVTVNYTGKLLNGSIFDSSEGKAPLEFPVGVGQVIPGWDEGISLLSEGTVATLIIPSKLGYGPMAMGPNLPANSILVFEVELVKIKK